MCRPLYLLEDSPDPLWPQQSLRPKDQKKWLEVKYVLYQQHQNTKTLGLFYPPLYEEYFAKWPPIPTAHDLEGAGGNLATAKARVRGHEEHVCDLELSGRSSF